ncbi:helix-hairpin-helix domain-containing protein [Pseudomonas lurida]|uniref:Helix-hairpin-helix domain-containing protein n=1 Tax=Pseudomonas lurida TaxID=244566 RepID=A0ABY9FLK1_9PSED|nr:helix-hairpin-helix domain-containing protein [Pseudomonas lurida]WLG25986.1 helix-hairpin-helix domain-containing protein [Pseudomonas lurida]WLH04203.1 helix-hairpin-helix domain-containing protein [Pseudomonas lurida]
MAFSLEERTALLALKGVGPTVISRLEQMGIESMDALAQSDIDDILAQASAALGSTCWKNSPQARAAITAAVEFAKRSGRRNAGQ